MGAVHLPKILVLISPAPIEIDRHNGTGYLLNASQSLLVTNAPETGKVCAARTLNATCPSRVTLSLR